MAKPETRKPKKVRSPAYPVIDLETAIQRTQTIYDHEKRNAAPVDVVVAHCGTDIKSSAGLRLIAALKQFGLAIEEGSGADRHIRLSDRALDILLAESEDCPERGAAIAEAALLPKIHRMLWDHYEGKLPSDQTIRAYLVRKLEFNDSTVNKFIKQIRATITFAKLSSSDTMDDESSSGDDSRSEEDGKPDGRASKPLARPKWQTGDVPMRELPITLPSLNVIVVRLPERMSDLDFTTFEKTISGWRGALVKPSEPANPVEPADSDE